MHACACLCDCERIFWPHALALTSKNQSDDLEQREGLQMENKQRKKLFFFFFWVDSESLQLAKPVDSSAYLYYVTVWC